MTAAQKKAKDKFKKAIEYRKKTGVSLKEAFAHIYGKKVGAVKKKAAVKKAAPKKKAAVKKAAPKKKIIYKKIGAKKISEKSILNKIHKVKKDVERLDEAQHSHMIGNIKKGSKYIYYFGYAIEKKPIEIIDQKNKKRKSHIYKTTFGIFHTLKDAKKYISDVKKGLYK